MWICLPLVFSSCYHSLCSQSPSQSALKSTGQSDKMKMAHLRLEHMDSDEDDTHNTIELDMSDVAQTDAEIHTDDDEAEPDAPKSTNNAQDIIALNEGRRSFMKSSEGRWQQEEEESAEKERKKAAFKERAQPRWEEEEQDREERQRGYRERQRRGQRQEAEDEREERVGGR